MILLNIIFIFASFSQQSYEAYLIEKNKKVTEYIQSSKQRISDSKKTIELNEKRKEQVKKEIKSDKELLKKRQIANELIDPYIDKKVGEINSWSFIKRATNNKRVKYFRCLNNNYQFEQFDKIEQCSKKYSFYFNEEDREIIKNLKHLSLSPESLERNISRNTSYLDKIEKNILKSKDSISNSEKNIKRDTKYLEQTLKPVEQVAFVDSQKNFKNCDVSMPTVDIESEYIYKNSDIKGPFYQIPRDNQDGLGTCYANTAKNLLVGLSGGKKNASYLDIALQYKKQNKGKDSIEGGNSCDALKAINENGFCDQSFAPIETGDSFEKFEEFAFKTLTPYKQARLLGAVKDFYNSQQKISIDDKVAKLFKTDPEEIVSTLKSDKKLSFPILPLTFSGISTYSMGQICKEVLSDDPSRCLQKFNSYDDKFKEKIEELYFEKKLVMSDLYEEYKKIVAIPFFKEIKKDIPQGLKQSFYDRWTYEFKPHERDENLYTYNFLKKYDSNDDCVNCENRILRHNFLESINSLSRKLAALDLDLNFLKSGNELKDHSDVIQLIVAPSCIDKVKRTNVDFDFDCQNFFTKRKFENFNGSDQDKENIFRKIILANLLKGMPVGNSFPTDPNEPYGGHINTIVGMKYNKDTKSCMLKIRESQTGTSDWHDLKTIYKKSRNLVQVSR